MTDPQPNWLDASPWLRADRLREQDTRRALGADSPGPADFAALAAPAADPLLESMARRAESLTRRHFGRTISLYAPLYLSNYCPSGCAYCGFASDRPVPRHSLSPDEIRRELAALHAMGFQETLLLTGERDPHADFDYLLDAVRTAAGMFHQVTIEAFPMETAEYRALAQAGCTGLTLYQETYDPVLYADLHRWGPKRDLAYRLLAPERALEAGMRTVGLGVLLGLGDPLPDVVSLFLHLDHLRRRYWRSGFSVSFPRLRPQRGDFEAPRPVSDRELARLICAFRICLPEVHLALSTRESPAFRDGMAGIGISKMSIASRTTVGGYSTETPPDSRQFDVSDDRTIESFCAMLRNRRLQPVFKNWDAAYREEPTPSP